MASACINNIGISPENFPAAPYPSYAWLTPRLSFSRDFPDDDCSTTTAGPKPPSPSSPPSPIHTHYSDILDVTDPDDLSAADFEFRLVDPVTMLPADQLFSDGKLVPLQLSVAKPSLNALISPEIRSPETVKTRRRADDISVTDPYIFSPKAPRCSSRWKELLGLKKLYQNSSLKNEPQKTTSSSSYKPNPKSVKHFLTRSSKSDASINQPLLRESDCESPAVSSSRLSLSSSSSGHEHDDLPRLSLDSDKPNPYPLKNPNSSLPRMRLVKSTATSTTNVRVNRGRSTMRETESTSSGVSVDSPRMNASGKIVYQSLERSSSSPSSFNGGPRFKHRGMERSYSANVRVTPVLNVPVSSLRGSSKSVSVFGLGHLFSSSPQKRDSNINNNNVNGNGGNSRANHHNQHCTSTMRNR